MPEQHQKTILIFSDWYYPGYKAGGPVQSAFNLSKLLSSNFIVKVVTRIYDLDEEHPYTNIKADTWIELEKNHFILYLSPEKITRSYIKLLIKENNYNILLINGLYSFYFSILPAFYALIYKVDHVFVSIRGMLHRSALSVKPLKKQVFLAFARGFGLYKHVTMLATSAKEEEEIIRSLGKVKIKIAPNIPLLPLDGQHLAIKPKEEKLRILFLGRISPEKDPITLVHALKGISTPCDVVFCGASIDRQYFSSFTRELSTLPVHITHHYIPELPHTRIKELFDHADLMVMPSLGENFGHAIFESFVFGVPVVIGNNTPWSGIKEKKAGLEIKPGDEKELADAIRHFIQMDEHAYHDWRQGAYNISQVYFRDNNFNEIYLRLFS